MEYRLFSISVNVIYVVECRWKKNIFVFVYLLINLYT